MAKKYLGIGRDFGATKLVNVADPTLANDGATKGYVDALVNGLVWHPAVRATVASNILTTNPGTAVFDGVTLVTGERILLRGQTAPAENGPWVFQTSSTALTRPVDFANAVVAPPATGIINATFFVQEGTSFTDTAWTLTTNGTITVGTTSLTFTQFGSGGATYTASLGVALSGLDFRLAATVGGAGLTQTAGVLDVVATDSSILVAANDLKVQLAASAGLAVTTGIGVDSTVARVFQTGTHASTTSIAVTHSLGKQFVCNHVFITLTGEEIDCDVVATSTAVMTFAFAVAPSANTLTFVIHA